MTKIVIVMMTNLFEVTAIDKAYMQGCGVGRGNGLSPLAHHHQLGSFEHICIFCNRIVAINIRVTNICPKSPPLMR